MLCTSSAEFALNIIVDILGMGFRTLGFRMME